MANIHIKQYYLWKKYISLIQNYNIITYYNIHNNFLKDILYKNNIKYLTIHNKFIPIKLYNSNYKNYYSGKLLIIFWNDFNTINQLLSINENFQKSSCLGISAFGLNINLLNINLKKLCEIAINSHKTHMQPLVQCLFLNILNIIILLNQIIINIIILLNLQIQKNEICTSL